MVYNIVTFLFTLTMSSISFLAQETDYLDAQLNSTDEKNAVFVRNLNLVSEAYYAAHVYDRSGKLRIEGFYLRTDEGLKEHGLFIFYHQNGNIESTGRFERGIKVGNWERYAVSGARRPDRYYSPETVELLRSVLTN